MTQWTSEIPTEPGFYWMYGWRSTQDSHNNSARMRLVKVQPGANDRLSYISEGSFISAPDVNGKSLWTPAVRPDVPHIQLEELLGVFLNWEER